MGKKPGLFAYFPTVQRSDKSEPPIIFPSVHQNFFASIGRLIVQWALMEQQLNILLCAVLAYNKTNEPGWKKRPFEKRWKLLKSEWDKFSNGSGLKDFLDPAHRHIHSCKVLRDSLAHKEMILGLMNDGNHYMRFFNETRAKQMSKPYYLADIQAAANAAQSAAGFFFWVSDHESAWPLALPDTQRLRSLPNTDHLKLPT